MLGADTGTRYEIDASLTLHGVVPLLNSYLGVSEGILIGSVCDYDPVCAHSTTKANI